MIKRSSVRTGPQWQHVTEPVGTDVTQELVGVFSGKMTKWKLKQWRARKETATTTTTTRFSTTLWFGYEGCESWVFKMQPTVVTQGSKSMVWHCMSSYGGVEMMSHCVKLHFRGISSEYIKKQLNLDVTFDGYLCHILYYAALLCCMRKMFPLKVASTQKSSALKVTSSLHSMQCRRSKR